MTKASKYKLASDIVHIFGGVTGLLVMLLWAAPVTAADDPSPPSAPVKLIFIHHSTGGNWLGDVDQHEQFDGGLGEALMANNYYASATNYGWSVNGDAIGDRTDIGHWWDWFRGPNRDQVMNALFNENGQNIGSFLPWTRPATDPGGENEVILFKSCFPNSHISGNPNDPPTTGDNPIRGVGNDLGWGGSNYTVGNTKGIYNDILEYFATRTDRLWVLITPPPITADDMYHSDEHTATHAANARALNDWLVNDWLDGYPHNNVAVFDFYNVLTSNGGDVFINDFGMAAGNHHRWNGSEIEHVQNVDYNFSAYGAYLDSHPTDAGGQKATAEFLPLLNIYYHRWKSGASPGPTAAFDFAPANPAPGETVSFTDRSTGAPSSWSWDFGDGTVNSSQRNPNHSFSAAGTYSVTLTVSNNSGSDSVSRSITVSGGAPGTADLALTLGASPDPVVVGAELVYRARVSNGGPATAWQTRLTHTLPGAVTFRSAAASQGNCMLAGGTVECALGDLDDSLTVTVTIRVTPVSEGVISSSAVVESGAQDPVAGNNSASVSTTVTSQTTDHLYLVAGVAHAPGAAGTEWRTDIAGVNLSGSRANLVFTFYSSGPPLTRSVGIGPGTTRRWRDVLVGLFEMSSSDSNAGSIQVSSDQPLYLTSRTYNETAEGTFGQYLPACTAADALVSGVTGVLPQLEKSDAFRTNIGFLNLGDAACTVVVRLFDSNGSEVCAGMEETVAEARWQQLNDIFSRCGAGRQNLAYGTVEVQTPGGMVWAYASVVDMHSGDPTTIPVLVH